jgi:hypothetical protein
MKAPNFGTVKAFWPWVWLKFIPFMISPLRSGAVRCTWVHAHPLGDEHAQALVAGRELGA